LALPADSTTLVSSMPLADPLPILPFTHPVRGEAELPGSKSITNRALLLAALCDGPTTLTGALFSEDTRIMTEALRKLGFTVKEDKRQKTIYVEGRGGRIPAPQADLFVGLAGTAARFLTALCAAAQRGTYRLDGVPQMRLRPMRGLIEALRSLGAKVRCLGEEGFLPVEIHASGLHGRPISVDASESSQILSALLMVAPLADAPVTATLAGSLRQPFVHMTARQMGEFGIPNAHRGPAPMVYAIPQGAYHSPGTYAVEPDATAASYFLALPLAVNGTVSLPHLRPPGQGLQGDTQFIEVLEKVGVVQTYLATGVKVQLEPGTPRRGVDEDFREFSDTFLTLAALAPLLEGPTTIRGIAHTRKQETDRVGAMAKELRKLGQQVFETEDSLEIFPRPLPRGDEPVEIETYGDHRFAMSFGILGCHDRHGDGRPWLAIRNPECCAKTFPNFFELLESLRRKSSE
jgi:3-phosphoshikimate 1-carboxyvinyltransferase